MTSHNRTRWGCAWRGACFRRYAHRRLSRGFQPLEERTLLSAEGLLPAGVYDAGAAYISPAWFTDYSDADTPSHVNPPSLGADLAAGDVDLLKSDGTRYDWIVRFHTESLTGLTTVAQTGTLLAGGGIHFEVVRGLGLAGQVMVRSSETSLKSVRDWLAANSNVASWELDLSRRLQATPDDSDAWRLWALNNTGQTGGTADADLDAFEAWDISTGSSSIVVGVIDTGVDHTHPDLAGNIWTNPGEIAGNRIDDDGNGFVDDVHGYDFINGDGDPMDDNDHGTHCAGTIAARGNNGQGVVGVNWSSSIMALKFLSSSGSGSTSDATRAINYATMMRTQYGVNVRVTNNSWGGGGYSASMYDAIRAHNAAGILFAAAAGNSGSNNDSSPHYPSSYNLPGVIAVAATDHDDALAGFSCYGSGSVDLAAPGASIRSTTPGGEYATFSGTSMATPHVAGVAALAWSVDPDATVAEIRAAILQGADSLPSLAGMVATGGRLNALGTLQLLSGGGSSAPFISGMSGSPNPVGRGQTVTLTAGQITDPDGLVRTVHFYRDANRSGRFDVGDEFQGADPVVANGGDATLSLSSAGLASGGNMFFALAMDDQWQWSPAAAATVTVTTPDRHADNAAGATPIALGNPIDGEIQSASDVDWFSFQAVSGRTYKLDTQLAGLADSILSLYDTDGATLLEYNDDVSWPQDPSSTITWQAPATGTYYVEVTNYWQETGAYLLELNHLDVAYDAQASTPGLYVPSAAGFHLRATSDPQDRTLAATPFCFGPADSGWLPLTGDFNADGVDTVGVYDPQAAGFHLKNVNANGPENRGADVILKFGPAGNFGWTPLAGDWDGDGVDTLGLYDPSVGGFHLKNSLTQGGGADLVFCFGPGGNRGWTPIIGDWDGDGVDTIGLYDTHTATFTLRASNSPLSDDLAATPFAFGPADAGWLPIAGDFNGSGYDTIGLYAPSTGGFYLKNVNANPSGNRGPDVALRFGPRDGLGLVPLTGNWDGPSQGGLTDAAAGAPDRIAVDQTLTAAQLPAGLTEEDFRYLTDALHQAEVDSRHEPGTTARDALFGDDWPLGPDIR